MKTSTIYQKSIKDPSAHTVLKKGSSNKKLGFNISAKKWRGKRLYSLTLVERETCPTSCHHWDDCYGNNMPFAHRFKTKGLMEKLAKEIPSLLEKHKDGIVIRLHVLGDFFSVDYVDFWSTMLAKYPKLALFGYTGRKESSDIGKAIRGLNAQYKARVAIRFSRSKKNKGNLWYAAKEAYKGESFDCPEQTAKVSDCASCGLCWTVPKTVRFLTH